MTAVEHPPRFDVHEVSDNIREICQQALDKLQENVPGLISAGVVGPDGFELAAVMTRPMEISKLAALSTTLIAIADAFAVESGLTACRDVILGTAGSCTLLLTVPVGPANYTMFVTAGSEAPLGSVLTNARYCLAEVKDALNGVSAE